MIDHSHRFIFVHIPKTAGNSVNRVFGVSWQNHKDLARYARECETFDTFFKFAIVRNPWDRMLSDYNYQKKKSRENKLHLLTPSGVVRSFKEWVRTVLSDPFRYPASDWGGDVSEGVHRWSPQVDWISLEGRIAVDEVIKLENLDQGFTKVREKLSLPPARLPRRNSRFHWHYSHYYDDATRDLVADYYAQDIRRFGYCFESPNTLLGKFWAGCRARCANAA
jgi:hypothetical protein